ncbi:MAG TPA: outer membrane protein transport protein [Thermoanaerobaculia bacterium]|nr:outer membrane protein transport protein [Thermoanaerobaculia bacterium]
MLLRRPTAVLALALAVLATAGDAAASGYGRFQFGGRATAQAGAFTARAADPSAVYYNPAAITRLEGMQLQGGLDFSNATDEYESDTAGSFAADHSIQFPPSLFFTWKDDTSPWAVGLGVDAAQWYRADWDPALFPPRFNTRLIDLELWEVHPVAAYDFANGWSLGGGVRYFFGSFEQGVNAVVETPGTGGVLFPAEIMIDADTDVDGYGFDLAAHFADTLWGFGVVYRTSVEVDGSGDVRRTIRDAPVDPVADAALRDQLPTTSASQGLDLPWELATGFWFSPYPELRTEIDLVYTGWSEFEQTFGPRPAGATTDVQRSGWDDTISLRLGLEGDVTDRLALSAGFGWEPSPVPNARVDPAFFRGDALVYAAGLSYSFPQISFDLGYAFHDHDDVTVGGQEPGQPGVEGTYSSREQVWSASARWRF